MEIDSKENDTHTKLFIKMNGDWEKQSSALRTKYPTLTSNDVKLKPGKETELITRVENRLGKTRDQVLSILNNNHKDVIDAA